MPLVKADSDDYSNSLIVYAPLKEQDDVADIIDDIDRQTQQAQQSRVFHLQYAVASDLQSVIQNMLTNTTPLGRAATGSTRTTTQQGGGFGPFGGGQRQTTQTTGGSVAADTRTNSLVVTATTEILDAVAKVVLNLDQPAAYLGTTWIYTMQNARCDVVANLLSEALGNRTTGGATGGSLSGSTISASSSSSSSGTPSLSTTTSKSSTSNTNYAGSSTLSIGSTAMDGNQRIVNVKSLLNECILVPNVDQNSIIITSPPDVKPQIEELLGKLDVKPQQVMIETLIVEAELDKKDQFGVELSGTMGKLFGSSRASGSVSSNPIGGQSSGFGSGGGTYTLNLGQYQAIVEAMHSDSNFKVLSTPRIFTTNNASGQLNISQAVPYQTGSTQDTTGNTSYSYGYLDIGIILTLTTHITSNGYVTMDVNQSANELQGYSSTLDAPIVNQREATTTVSVKDGQTIVLGGIINDNVTDTAYKVPVLGDIPLIGNLFKSRSKEDDHTELLIFMTPHVVTSPEDADKILADTEKELGRPVQQMIPAAVHGVAATSKPSETPAAAGVTTEPSSVATPLNPNAATQSTPPASTVTPPVTTAPAAPTVTTPAPATPATPATPEPATPTQSTPTQSTPSTATPSTPTSTPTTTPPASNTSSGSASAPQPTELKITTSNSPGL